MPSLNTASLPDLVFTLLFFFMIVTNFREPKPQVEFEIPHASETEKVGQKSLITFIYIGNNSPESQTDSTVQINNSKVALSEIVSYLDKEKEKLHEDDKDKMSVVLKIDKHVKMSLVSEVKESLRKANVLNISYAVNDKPTPGQNK